MEQSKVSQEVGYRYLRDDVGLWGYTAPQVASRKYGEGRARPGPHGSDQGPGKERADDRVDPCSRKTEDLLHV